MWVLMFLCIGICLYGLSVPVIIYSFIGTREVPGDITLLSFLILVIGFFFISLAAIITLLH